MLQGVSQYLSMLYLFGTNLKALLPNLPVTHYLWFTEERMQLLLSVILIELCLCANQHSCIQVSHFVYLIWKGGI